MIQVPTPVDIINSVGGPVHYYGCYSRYSARDYETQRVSHVREVSVLRIPLVTLIYLHQSQET